MAAIQGIRKHGKLLIAVIGIALLAFITEEFFRATEAQRNQNNGVVATIDGKKVNQQELSALIDGYKNYFKLIPSQQTPDEDQIRVMAWQDYITSTLIEAEASKLGLTVTERELQNVISEGRHGMLQGVAAIFRDPQTGGFSATMLKNFLAEYKKMQSGNSQVPEQYREQYNDIYNLWMFVENQLRQQLLQQKYLALTQMAFTSNPTEAKFAFNAAATSKDLLLATIPYSSINDNEIKVSDQELKAKYEELKETFKIYNNSKDIKFISVDVKASPADKAELDAKMAAFAQQLDTATDVAAVVRLSQSQITYTKVPRTAKAFTDDISAVLDSMAAGTQRGPYYNPADNTENIVRLIAKTQAPDSIQIRQIQVGAQTVDEARKRADSIYTALKGGADFAELAKKYNQTGDSIWITSNAYENGAADDDNVKFLNRLQTMQVGEMQNFDFTQGNIIVAVTGRKNIVTKYDAAVIKVPLAFSKATSTAEYNKFSKFIAENKTPEAMEKNAPKAGYNMQTLQGVETSTFFSPQLMQPGMEQHMMRWISGDAKKWIFDEAKDGAISPLYVCDNGNHLLVLAVTKSHEAGYVPLEDVKDYVKAEVLRDKKAEKIMANLKGAKTIAQVLAAKDAVSDTVKNVTFFSDGQYEPVILGSVVKAKANQFVGPLKGTAGVYAYQVLSTNTNADAKYDEKQAVGYAASSHARLVTPTSYYGPSFDRIYQFLQQKAKVTDNRYRFY